MRCSWWSSLLALAACSSPAPPPPKPPQRPPVPAEDGGPKTEAPSDPTLWLEDITGEKALAWVKERNAVTTAELEKVPGFAALQSRVRTILDSKDKTPYVRKRAGQLYNFWQDDTHPRGILRRTALAEYRKAKPAWETVLDIDALGAAEKESWVYEGSDCLPPNETRCLVTLSRGGADAAVVREFDAVTKKFVDGGFSLPEAKSSVAWKDDDTIYVATDFGAGSMTTSGYPRIVKEWKRGTKLAEATTVFEGKHTDISVSAGRTWDHGKTRDFVQRGTSFFASETHLRDAGGKLTRVAVPDDAEVSWWDDQLLITLRTDWRVGDKTWPKGALLATRLDDFMAGKRDFTVLSQPTEHASLQSFTPLGTALVVSELEDVHDKLTVWTHGAGGWTKRAFAAPAGLGAFDTLRVVAYDDDGSSDDYWLYTNGYTSPATTYLGALGKNAFALKESPRFYDAKDVVVEQHFAISLDGTRVPYFQLNKSSVAANAPALLYGYGGFEVSLTPGYDPIVGAAWLERGGVYVVANIRGGGEYGPRWHQAAMKHDRQRAYDDFIAVAQDLIRRGVTSTQKLGIDGGSNGGLLMGVMLVERPDLFGAIVCEQPLLDMQRYHKLLAGASWMEEYGNPDDAADWAALARFSPFQNVKADATYPRTLFTSSTKDDRVHPGHARRMVAKMLGQKHDVLYYENIEGGHHGAADNGQVAYREALVYSFLAKQLGLK